MKVSLLSIFLIFLANFSKAQTFSFVNNSTTLIKTTDQSPAHWYIEIVNDLNIDTALRWKSIFEDVPTQWQITFDDQTTFHTDVNHGDSADFALPISGTFPQKLIIGAMLNNTPASATIHFEVYDPFAPSVKDTISFIFYVSQGSANLNELQKEGIVYLDGNMLFLLGGEKSDFLVYDAAGKLVSKTKDDHRLDMNSLPQNRALFLQFSVGMKTYVVKISKD